MAGKQIRQTLKRVEALRHEEAARKNIPTAELQSVMAKDVQSLARVAYERRNRDLDPQLVWRGKDQQDWSDLVVLAPPLFIQEKIHPKVLIDDLMRHSQHVSSRPDNSQIDLFADFNGLPGADAKTEFYQHDSNWTNRMILGDSLQVMASLAEREGLRGKVQCVYFDPPYGIRFNSNFQWSTTSHDVKEGVDSITREPEQVKAFRDTWRDGIHSYLTYLRDRLTVVRDLLTDSGSVFVQIGEENVHRVRSLLDEVFGQDCYRAEIKFKTTGGHSSGFIASVFDTILWYGRSEATKFRRLYFRRSPGDEGATQYTYGETSKGERGSLRRLKSEAKKISRVFQPYPLVSMGKSESDRKVLFEGGWFEPTRGRHWSVKTEGTERIGLAGRLFAQGKNLRFVYYLDDYPVTPFTNIWTDTQTSGFASDRIYVVQTLPRVVERCILMATDPGDLVLDPTCGSGTTGYSAEQWGRRWITIDTSRVALALARGRLMGARYPYYLLKDSREGQLKEAEVTKTEPSTARVYGNVCQGFVYERAPHVTLKSIAKNAEIDAIWVKFQQSLEPLREQINRILGQKWKEWQIPLEAEQQWPKDAKELHTRWWLEKAARQSEIDASIAAKADYEHLYNEPYIDDEKVRVAGPFTVESVSPHRTLGVDENSDLIDPLANSSDEAWDFTTTILENLKTAGVQQAHKVDKIVFSAGWLYEEDKVGQVLASF